MADDDEPGRADIGLAEAIAQIRDELQRAAVEGSGQPIGFRPSSVELNLEVAFERKAGADAGVRVWVVSANARGEWREAHTQRITVKLDPFDRATGRSSEIKDRGTH